MAKRKGPTFYKQIIVGTKDLGNLGAQIHICRIEKLQEQLKGCYINNVVISCMTNAYADEGGLGAFTLYLSPRAAGDWDNDAVMTGRSTPGGGGTVSLSARRRIQTNVTGDATLGPIHVWAEMTDIPEGTQEARFVIEVWGRMHLLTPDLD